jgi:hypothetical protein
VAVRPAAAGPEPAAMSRPFALTLYVAAMVVVIVAVDLAVFRDRFTARLIANAVIVLLFGVGYLWFFRRP